MKLASIAACLSITTFSACTAKESTKSDTAAVAAPATAPLAEPTANDISNYRLDMDRMRRYSKALQGFALLARADSAAADAMASNSNESTVQMIAKLENSPAAMKVLRDAGLTAKDYVWTTAAWIQAAMTEAMLESNKNAKLPEGQNPQNLEFVKTHKAELDSLSRLTEEAQRPKS